MTSSEAQRILDTNQYLSLATADADGMPWATIVWFAPAPGGVVWASHQDVRHPLNIAARPEVGIAVQDQSAAEPMAVYLEAIATEVPLDELDAALAIYSARSEASGFGVWTRERVTGAASLRLFRATATRTWLLGRTTTGSPPTKPPAPQALRNRLRLAVSTEPGDDRAEHELDREAECRPDRRPQPRHAEVPEREPVLDDVGDRPDDPEQDEPGQPGDARHRSARSITLGSVDSLTIGSSSQSATNARPKKNSGRQSP